jgi:hypothetical protein
MTTSQQKIQTLVEQAERNRLYGEIHLRFRAGQLTFITEEKTTSLHEEGTSRNDYPSR